MGARQARRAPLLLGELGAGPPCDPSARVPVHATAGETQGFYAFYHREVVAGGAPRLLINTEYGFINAHHRGDLGARLAAARAVLGIAARHPLIDKYGIFVVYPPSFVAISHYAHRLVSPRDPDLGGFRRGLLESFLRDTVGDTYDPETGVVKMRTRPTAPLHTPRSARGRRAPAWYEARTPRWREGYALPILVDGTLRRARRPARARARLVPEVPWGTSPPLPELPPRLPGR